MKRLRYISGILCCLLGGILTLNSCTDKSYHTIGGYAQGGTWQVRYRGASLSRDKVQSAVDSMLLEIDFTLSGYNKGSLLSRFNAGEEVVITPMFADLYEKSYRMWERSEGAFDAASGPLFDIWGFGFTSGTEPSPEEVSRVLASCGTARLSSPEKVWETVGKSVRSLDFVLPGKGDTPPRLNFNAIAQGYSCDLVEQYLTSLGASDMLVDIGEIMCCGLNPRGRGWTIGVDNPVDGNNTPGADIRDVWTSDGGRHGIVTSGNYRKFYIKDGKKYSHTIDPRTGYPVQHSLLSATVVADNACEADALATWFMVIGFDKAREYALAHESEIQACLISADTVWKNW